jgi:thiamine-monophosphate kinase
MIDISDGLSSDLGHILTESGGVGAILDATAIPVHPDATALSLHDGAAALDHALHDGKDFELCLTVAPEDAGRLVAVPPSPATLFRVGEVRETPGQWLRKEDGTIRRTEPRGSDHVRTGK